MKGKVFIAGLLAVGLLAGCATKPIPAEEARPVPAERQMMYQSAPAEGYGELVVTRDTGTTASACTTQVFIDAQTAAEMRVGETVRFFVPAGRVILGMDTKEAYCGGGLKEREVIIEAGEERRYRISIDSAMSTDLSPTAF